MAKDISDDTQKPDEDRKRGNVIIPGKIVIMEQDACGNVKRVVDPSEFGIEEQPVKQNEKPQNLLPHLSQNARPEPLVPARPKGPTIYEENFGGTNRRPVTLDELKSGPK